MFSTEIELAKHKLQVGAGYLSTHSNLTTSNSVTSPISSYFLSPRHEATELIFITYFLLPLRISSFMLRKYGAMFLSNIFKVRYFSFA